MSKRSLLEQKKIQWAKEREELTQLSVPWGKTYSKFDKNIARGKALSKFSNSEVSLNREKHLPPIRNKSYDHYELEGDTSGYASDAKEGSPEYYSQKKESQGWNHWHHRSSESDVSICRDERLKWGDRGLGVAHLWEPHELDEHISKTVEREPPGWLQRTLQSDNKEVVVVNSNSPETGDSSTDRPFTGESSNINMNSLRTHLRGQNIPLEPNEVAERERKRQKALELQNAIKQQLEEREIKRKQDRERKIREEVEEESRIRREQEIERMRVEEEQKLLNEKKERERKRNEAMQEAIENAEKAAKLEKSKQKRIRSNVLNIPDEEIQKESSSNNMLLIPSPRNSNRSPIPEIIPQDNQIVPESNQNSGNEQPDNLTVILQNPFDNLQGMQLALLVPTTNEAIITENRVLTPSVYRIKKNSREISTQTESNYFKDRPESNTKDNYGSLDRRRGSNASDKTDKTDKRERRMRSEERPKWGANKPPMRYLKQSEKDPAYQKRKMRQKTREIIYEDKNNNYSQSSDDSMPQTPDRRLRHRNLWHKNQRMFSQNISVYQTEIVPLELDRQGRLYVKEERVTTKKYRNPTPDSSRKERLNERNERKRMESEGLLVKLDNLRHGLLLRQQQWDDDSESVQTNKSTVELPDVHDNS